VTPVPGPLRANSHSIWQEDLLLPPVRILQKDPVHVMAILIGHRGYNSVIAVSTDMAE
jgi:hypothetical protein